MIIIGANIVKEIVFCNLFKYINVHFCRIDN